MDAANADDVRAFLVRFPNGEFANEARRKYSLLAHDKLPPRVQHVELHYPLNARGLTFRALRSVILDAVVSPGGKADNITFTRRRGVDAMDEAAISAARKATYLPAVDNGTAVQQHLTDPGATVIKL